MMVLGAAVVMGMLVFAAGSLGAARSGPPRFGILRNKEVFSTRVLIDEELVPEELVTKWTASYSENAGGPWTFVNGGEAEALKSGAGQGVQIGAFDNESGGPGGGDEAFFLRGLKPNAQYYARFTAENADGKRTKRSSISRRCRLKSRKSTRCITRAARLNVAAGKNTNTTFESVAVAAPILVRRFWQR